MAVQKITSNIISPGATGGATALDSVAGDGTGALVVPKGTTAQRPVSPAIGYLRYNTTTGFMEQYNSLGWQAITAPPTIVSVSPTAPLSSSDPQTIVVTGTNFDAGTTVSVIAINGSTVYTPDTVTINTTSQITITFAGANTLTGDGRSGSGEPYAVKVTAGSGLYYTLSGAFSINDAPTFTTAAGSLGTVYATSSASLAIAATDPEGTGLTYSVTTGSLPGGLSLNSSTGAITGTVSGGTYSSGGTTFNFTGAASDGAQTTTRSFSILQKWYDGSTSALAPSSPNSLRSIGITTNGTYYLKPDSGSAGQFYCVLDGSYGNYGWALAMRYYNPFYYGQLLRNGWNGHNGQNGPTMSTASTWDGTYGTYLPDSASYVLFGFTNNNSNTLDEFVHISTVGSPSDNSGFWNQTAGYTNSYNIGTVVQQQVTGMASPGTAVFYFRDIPPSSYDYYPRGYGVNLAGPSSNVDNTNNLLGAIADSCDPFTMSSGVTTISRYSETYIGSRKNLDGGSGANGSYCGGSLNTSSYGKWMMFWR